MKLLDVIAADDELGECPIWNARDQRLWWTDIQGRRLRSWDLLTLQVQDVEAPERIGSFAFVEGRPGVLLTAFETGIAWYRPGDAPEAPEWISRPEIGTGRRFNDGCTDRQGRFWAGTMVEDGSAAGTASAALWRIDGEGGAAVQRGGVSISNGLCTSPDGRTLYFADSPRQAILAYDLDPDTGAITGERLFAEVVRGYPDGATVDAQGHVWSARWASGEVVRYDPSGRVVEVVRTPATLPTCVAFGGPDLSLMFVTSAKDGLTAAERTEQPLAGAVFIYEVDSIGLAEVAFDPASRAPES